MPGLGSFGIAVLTFDSHTNAEEAFGVLKNPSRLHIQSYRVFANRETHVLWAEPFFDLERELTKETRHVIVSNLPLNISVRTLEEELACFGQVEKLRKYADWAVVWMRVASEAKTLHRSKFLLVDGRKCKVQCAARLAEDPQEPDVAKGHRTPATPQPVYELSVLELSTTDRQRIYETVQPSKAFPAEDCVRGLSVELLNKARRLLQHSRRPKETNPTGPLLGEEAKPPFERNKPPRYYDPHYAGFASARAMFEISNSG